MNQTRYYGNHPLQPYKPIIFATTWVVYDVSFSEIDENDKSNTKAS